MIKLPLMQLAADEPHATYITLNLALELYIPDAIAHKSIGLEGDICGDTWGVEKTVAMRTPQYIVETLPEQVKNDFLYWTEYMENNLVFHLPDSEWHTKGHCERVLLYALLIGVQVSGCGRDELRALAHASIFHDTCRQDDFLDVEHGARAASYYMKYCEQNKDLVFLEPAYLIMKYHDRDDKVGMEAIGNAVRKIRNRLSAIWNLQGCRMRSTVSGWEQTDWTHASCETRKRCCWLILQEIW